MKVLRQEAQENSERLTRNLSQHLIHIEAKFTESTEKPVLKNCFNIKHWERNNRYLHFIKDAKYNIQSGCYEDALACLDTCVEALKKYQSQIILADQSEAGWELVDRMGEGAVDREIKTLEKKILEERRSKRKGRDDPEGDQIHQVAKQGRSGARSFGPCIWCGGSGHGYKFCEQWKV